MARHAVQSRPSWRASTLSIAGAYAEHVAIPRIALKNLFRIPDGLSAAHATFLARSSGSMPCS